MTIAQLEARAVRWELLHLALDYRQLGNLAAIGTGLQVEMWARAAHLEAEARVLMHTRNRIADGIRDARQTLARFDPSTAAPKGK